jgi:uncharacterized protein YdbL (DUF1318 family)
MLLPFHVTRPKFKLSPPSFFFGGSLAIAGALAACVTVNVNFPESAVQQATDDYVRDIYRVKESGKTSAKPSATATPIATPTAEPKTSSGVYPQYYFAAILLPSAQADVSFNLSSPKTEQIKAKMKARIPEIIDQKRAGVLGETNQGSLVIHDGSKLKPLLKKRVEDFVHDENGDRETLYAEIVNSNHLGSANTSAVQRSFARSFQAESPSGTWVETPEGAWSQKP